MNSLRINTVALRSLRLEQIRFHIFKCENVFVKTGIGEATLR